MKKDKKKKEKRGKANMDAWEAARKVAKAIRKGRKQEDHYDDEWSRLPWREIRDQLKRSGTVVDLEAVPPTWTTESQQVADMREILEQAGFKKDGHIYRWES